MMHDFADTFVQFLLYMCFLVLMGFIIGSSFFSLIRWLINWIAT